MSNYHKERRMFFVINKKLVIAEPGYEDCHLEWLVNEGYSRDNATKIIENELRGVIDPDGNIKFFIKENWEINYEIENEFFRILPELVYRLGIKESAEIGGGAIQQEEGKIWPPRKKYGKVADHIKKEMVILVDDDDNEIGIEEKMEAHKNGGKRHRAFSVMIFNDKGEMMLQKRALGKYHAGGLWTNTCCSHPRPGEETEIAVHRRLKEEMGFDCELEKLFEFNYVTSLDHSLTENEHDHVFVGYYNSNPRINQEEVAEWKWIGVKDLDKDMAKNPDDYTPWFRKIFKQTKQLSFNLFQT